MLLFDNILSKVDNIRTDLKGIGADISTFTKSSKDTKFEVTLTGKKRGMYTIDSDKNVFHLRGEKDKKKQETVIVKEEPKKEETKKEEPIDVEFEEENKTNEQQEEPKQEREFEGFSFSNYPFMIQFFTERFNLSIKDLESLEENSELTVIDSKYFTHFKITSGLQEQYLVVTAVSKGRNKEFKVLNFQFTKDGNIKEFK